jgi:hypothetical protein
MSAPMQQGKSEKPVPVGVYGPTFFLNSYPGKKGRGSCRTSPYATLLPSHWEANVGAVLRNEPTKSLHFNNGVDQRNGQVRRVLPR